MAHPCHCTSASTSPSTWVLQLPALRHSSTTRPPPTTTTTTPTAPATTSLCSFYCCTIAPSVSPPLVRCRRTMPTRRSQGYGLRIPQCTLQITRTPFRNSRTYPPSLPTSGRRSLTLHPDETPKVPHHAKCQ
ncbi:hypothetical protein BDW02DRAFT_201253 [Decorospora gaudefroyi]|uniref:Uncharacterized protein n=1 Tax=Decorospora gaudefroyi TaxID=184978 RepID=A0A6A5KNW2_9PLEO|nr:hypothetical protein BDW02DRAFT_201253 [Decorospora gaudefroyi]